MLKFIQSEWFRTLFTAAIAIIAVLLTQKIVSGREYDRTLEEKFTARPTYDYVNNQDNALKESLKAHIDESDKINKAQLEYWKSIDTKLNIILSKQ